MTALLYVKAAFEQEPAQKRIEQAVCLERGNGCPLLGSKKFASYCLVNRCFQRIKASVFVDICFCQIQAHHVPELCLVQTKRHRYMVNLVGFCPRLVLGNIVAQGLAVFYNNIAASMSRKKIPAYFCSS